MKKVIFVLFMLVSSLCLFSCVKSNNNDETNTNHKESSDIRPDNITYENENIVVSGINNNVDTIEIYVGDRLIVTCDKSCVFDGVLEHSYTIGSEYKETGVLIKAIAYGNNKTGEISKRINYLDSLNSESVKYGQYYLTFDEVENAQKYLIEFEERDTLNRLVKTSNMESDSNFVEFEESINNKFDRDNNLYIIIKPYAVDYISYSISFSYKRTVGVTNLSYSNNKITFSSGYESHHIVIEEDGNKIDEIIDKDYYDYTPQGHDFSISVSSFERDKELKSVNLNIKAVNNLNGLSFKDKTILIDDDSSYTYTYKLYKNDYIYKSGDKVDRSIYFSSYYSDIKNIPLRLVLTKNINTKTEYLVGDTEFNLLCIDDFYVSDPRTNSDMIDNKKTFNISNTLKGSSVEVSVYKDDELVDNKTYEFSTYTKSAKYVFDYDKDSRYKVIFERKFLDDRYIINSDIVHNKYELDYDIPNSISPTSFENVTSNQIKIGSENLKDGIDDCSLFLDDQILKDTYNYDNYYLVQESKFINPDTYNLYLVSKKYVESDAVDAVVDSLSGSYTNYVRVNNSFPTSYYSVSLYRNNKLLKTNLYSDDSPWNFRLSEKTYTTDLKLVYRFRYTYSEKFNITRLQAPEIDILDNKLQFSGGENYDLLDNDEAVFTNQNVSEYQLNYDNISHNFKIRSLGNKSNFELDSDYSTSLAISFIENPVIEVSKQTLSWYNLADSNYSFLLTIDNVEFQVSAAYYDFTSLINEKDEISFSIKAISQSKYILPSEVISYQINKRTATGIISNIRVNNSTQSIVFDSNSLNETYDYMIYNSHDDLVEQNTITDKSVLFEHDFDEYRFEVSVGSKINNTTNVISMVDTNYLKYDFIKDGIISISRANGKIICTTFDQRFKNDTAFEFYYDDNTKIESALCEIVPELSTKYKDNPGTYTFTIKDISSNSSSNSINRLKCNNYNFSQLITKVAAPSLSKTVTYGDNYTLDKNTAFSNDLSYSSTVTATKGQGRFNTFYFERYYNTYYRYTDCIIEQAKKDNGESYTSIKLPTLEDTYTGTNSVYTFDAKVGCYKVLCKIIGGDFSLTGAYYLDSDFSSTDDYTILAPINKAEIQIKDGSHKNGLLYFKITYRGPYPNVSNLKSYASVSITGSSISSFSNTYVLDSLSTELGNSISISSSGIQLSKSLVENDVISITIHLYNEYGRSAILVLNNIQLSTTKAIYGS